MAFIRERDGELTGFQSGRPCSCSTDINTDFAMVYRMNDTTAERIEGYRKKGYAVHLMVGIAWGSYTDYLDGEWDGRDRWDECQCDRFGNRIMHGERTPYMVPTVAFADYLSEKLRPAVDSGVEAIHVEEPEFWDRGGYSEAFRREYALYYREPWCAPHTSCDAHFRAAMLKRYLYRRTIDRVSSALKEYAMSRYGRVLRFYVPTHSLLNYNQWKIVSPEGALADCAAVDGYIAQIWTGTSRTVTPYNGVLKERTFENAFLEYGIMQELTKGTDRTMWFLHDPIEDSPQYTWENYRYNYLKTVTASLLHPKVNRYEVSPWPGRVFDGKFPKDSPDAVEIPADYASLLCSVFQTLGDMPVCESAGTRTGVLLSDTALFERDYPDDVLDDALVSRAGDTVVGDTDDAFKKYRKLFAGENSREGMLEYMRSIAFPAFYGLCMPLLKRAVPVRPVSLDNVRRYTGYLDDYDVLLLSYEFMKPEYPDVNNALASWVRAGGKLIYLGDGSDPYHKIRGWWNSGAANYASPAQHLFEVLGIKAEDKKLCKVGNGIVAAWNINPAEVTFSPENAEKLCELYTAVASTDGLAPAYGNALCLRRGKYIVAAVLDEGDEKPLVLDGLFSDMYTTDYRVITRKTLLPDENTLLLDYSLIADEEPAVVGTSARVLSLERSGNTVRLSVKGMENVGMHIRLRVPSKAESAVGVLEDGSAFSVSCEYDDASRTSLLAFDGSDKKAEITLTLC